MDKKRYLQLVSQIQASLLEETREAREIKEMCEEMVESTKSECKEMVLQAHSFVESMDPVMEAKQKARDIIEEAQEEALRIRREAEEMQALMIQQAEDVRNNFIGQGQEYVSDLFTQTLDLLEKQTADLSLKHQKVAAYMESIQQPSASTIERVS